jgi:hypothetical protein
VLIFDLFWVWLVWKNWWIEGSNSGLVWRKLQRLHTLGIIFNLIGVFLKLVAVFSLIKSDGKEMVGEQEKELLISRHQGAAVN